MIKGLFPGAGALAAIATPLLLAGCATPDPQLGLNVQTNILAQVVDLDPVYAGVPIEGGSAERQADALKRYRAGKVTPLDITTITKK